MLDEDEVDDTEPSTFETFGTTFYTLGRLVPETLATVGNQSSIVPREAPHHERGGPHGDMWVPLWNCLPKQNARAKEVPKREEESSQQKARRHFLQMVGA